ncbi:MAG TPA: ribbon-helix-helix protein, CopG family [Burkholderiales bacterium]|jgi:predicted transcriptional regulator
MDLLSIKVPAGLRRRLAQEARRRGVSQSTVVRESLEAALVERPRARGELSCADLAADLIGSMAGPRDASTNKRYLEEAMTADYSRHGGKKRRR